MVIDNPHEVVGRIGIGSAERSRAVEEQADGMQVALDFVDELSQNAVPRVRRAREGSGF